MTNYLKRTTLEDKQSATANVMPQRLRPSQLFSRALIATCLGLVWLASLLWNPEQTSFLPCYFRELTGQPCPSCGLTRSFHAIAHLHFQQAFQFHPMGIILYVAGLISSVIALVEIILKKAIPIKLNSGTVKYALGILLLIWAVWWISKLFSS